MSRVVRVSTIQPPGGDFMTPFRSTNLSRLEFNEYVVTEAVRLLEQVVAAGVDVVCFPELLTVFGLERADALARAEIGEQDKTVTAVRDLASTGRAYVLLPILEKVAGGHYANTTLLIDRTGSIVGKYRKTHVTDQERSSLSVEPGDTYPVFSTDFGVIGIMTCWDIAFPEVARILSLRGAEVLFHPRWMSGPSEISHEIQARSRAIDNSVWVVSSSYGIEGEKAWRPGMFFAKSNIIGPDGTIVADAGRHVGIVTSAVDLDQPMLMDVLDEGGDVQDLKKLVISNRRPETYGELCRGG